MASALDAAASDPPTAAAAAAAAGAGDDAGDMEAAGETETAAGTAGGAPPCVSGKEAVPAVCTGCAPIEAAADVTAAEGRDDLVVLAVLRTVPARAGLLLLLVLLLLPLLVTAPEATLPETAGIPCCPCCLCCRLWCCE